MKKERQEIFAKENILNIGIISVLFLMNWVYHAKYMHNPRVLYSDELEGFSTLVLNHDTTLLQKIFGTEVIRPIPRSIYLILFQIGKTFENYSLINYVLLFANFGVAVVVYRITYALAETENDKIRYLLGLGTGILYTVSRFMQCQIFSILGIMEDIAQAAVLLMFYEMVQYIKKSDEKAFWKVLIFWILAFLSHERYFVLILAIDLVVLIKKEKMAKKISGLAVTTVIASVYLCCRIKILGNNMLRGTGASNVSETFSIGTFVKSMLKQVAYILGINTQEATRSGINYRDVPGAVNIVIVVGIFFTFYLLVNYLICRWRKKDIAVIIIGGSVMMCCIAASSVTTAVALRFVYVSYSLWLILMAYMVSCILNSTADIKRFWVRNIAICYFFSAFILDNYYGTTIKNLGLMTEKNMCESLYNVTIGYYKEQMKNASLIVIVQRPDITEEWYTNHLIPYMSMDNVTVKVVHTVEEAKKLGKPGNIVIYEDPVKLCYTDVTRMVIQQ